MSEDVRTMPAPAFADGCESERSLEKKKIKKMSSYISVAGLPKTSMSAMIKTSKSSLSIRAGFTCCSAKT